MAVKGGASPLRGGEYKGLFQKESEEFRMEHQRDKRPIYSLSSKPNTTTDGARMTPPFSRIALRTAIRLLTLLSMSYGPRPRA